MPEKEREKKSVIDLESFKKLPREERRKIREKRRIEDGFPTKMTLYLWFVLIFAGIVTFFDGWCTIAITLAMGGFGGGFEVGLEKITNPDLFTYFGLTGNPVIMGIILSIAGIGVVLAVSFKYMVDKYGRRPLTLITAVAFLTFTVLTAFSPPRFEGLIIFLILRILANFFLSADIVTIIIAEEAPDHLRGRLVGIVLATNAIGGFVCGIFQTMGIQVGIPGPWGGALSTWQSLFFLSIIGYIFIIPLFFFLKETKRFTAMKKYEDWRKKKGLVSKVSWTAPLKRQYIRPMALGCIMGFLGTLIYFAQVSFFALYYAKELNMSSTAIGIASLPSMVAAAVGYYIAGPLMDRWGRRPCIFRFGASTLLGGALFSSPAAFVAGDISNILLMVIAVIGGTIGIFSLVIVTLATTIIPLEMLPTHIRSTAMGWIGSVSRGAMILAPLLMMFGSEKLGGLGCMYNFMFALQGITLATLLFTAYILAPESKGRGLEEIVVSEVYTKTKIIRDKEEYRKPYYFYFLGMISYFILIFIYSFPTGAPIINILSMMGFYAMLSIICFFIVIYVRKIITE